MRAVKRAPVRIVLILATLALLTPARGPAAVALEIKVLSDRADLITSGDALVEVVIPTASTKKRAGVGVSGTGRRE